MADVPQIADSLHNDRSAFSNEVPHIALVPHEADVLHTVDSLHSDRSALTTDVPHTALTPQIALSAELLPSKMLPSDQLDSGFNTRYTFPVSVL